MDLDFALILVALTGVCGVVWLIDAIFFASNRKAQIAELKSNPRTRDLSDKEITKLVNEPSWRETGRSMFPVLLVVLVLRSFIVEPFQIPSGSMLPTLKIGDFILVNKFEYGLRLPVIGTKVLDLGEPERGDVVVFKFPENPKVHYIKRLVGLPGDTIVYHNKRLFVNGVEQEVTLKAQIPPTNPKQFLFEENLGGVTHEIYKDNTPARISYEWVVPQGHYFMIGDNRDNSNDSRFWGFVPEELLVGKAFAVWMSWTNVASFPSFSENRMIQ